MIHLRFGKEYLAGPVFCPDPEKMGHVDLKDLPISENLRVSIVNWNHEYQDTFNSEYPPDSGFATPESEHLHDKKGAVLAKRLQAELGDAYLVEYK